MKGIVRDCCGANVSEEVIIHGTHFYNPLRERHARWIRLEKMNIPHSTPAHPIEAPATKQTHLFTLSVGGRRTPSLTSKHGVLPRWIFEAWFQYIPMISTSEFLMMSPERREISSGATVRWCSVNGWIFQCKSDWHKLYVQLFECEAEKFNDGCCTSFRFMLFCSKLSSFGADLLKRIKKKSRIW